MKWRIKADGIEGDVSIKWLAEHFGTPDGRQVKGILVEKGDRVQVRCAVPGIVEYAAWGTVEHNSLRVRVLLDDGRRLYFDMEKLEFAKQGRPPLEPLKKRGANSNAA